VFLVHALVDAGHVDRAEPLLDEATTLWGGDPVYELDPIRGDIGPAESPARQGLKLHTRGLGRCRPLRSHSVPSRSLRPPSATRA
jgi:hypothetical protein